MTGFSLRRLGSWVLAGCLGMGSLAGHGQTGVPAAANSVAPRSKALSSLLDQIWQDRLKHPPEFAASIGDKRYNDQLTDYSAKEVNAGLARGRDYIQQLSEIDTTGLSEQERLSADLMLRPLIEGQEGAKFKEWEMPVNQFNGFHTDLAQLPDRLQFDSIKDYDDYIARLTKVPTAFSQIMTNMQLGVDEGRTPPQYLMEKVLAQTETLAGQKAEDSPFAVPLKRFPKSVSAADQKRITSDLLQTISTDVLPMYKRFAGFLKAEYIPKSRKEPAIGAIPSGDDYYAFRIRQSTTLNKSAAEIHQMGLEEVKRDEAEMLAIVKGLGFTDIKSFSAALKANPKEHATSRQALIDDYKGSIAGMKPKLPELFGRLPKAPLEIVPVPSYMEKDQSAAYFDNGTPDGSR